jgi:hypothetical protein
MPAQTIDALPARDDTRDSHSQGSRTRDTSTEEIANLAYLYWVERQRSRTPGSDIGDWLRAETEVIRRREAALDEASEESFPASDPPSR